MKSDKATILQRVEEVLQLRLLGAGLPDIRRRASEQQPAWGVCDRQLQRYIQASDKRLAEILDKNPERLLNLHIAQRQALYARCMAANDFSNARAVLKDLGELLNLYPVPVKRIEASGPHGGPIPTANVELTEDERCAAIAALNGRLARVGAADSRPAADRPGDGAGSTMGTARTPDDGSGNDAGPLATDVAPLNL
jgi:hypothetical protein